MMKNQITLACILLSILFCTSALAQKKITSAVGKKMAKELRGSMSNMIDNATFRGKITGPCYPTDYFKKLSKKELLPDQKTLAKELDSIRLLIFQNKELEVATDMAHLALYSFTEAKSYSEFVNNLYKKSIGDLRPQKFAKTVDTYYRSLKNLKTKGFVIDKKTITKGRCTYLIETKFEPSGWETTRNMTLPKKPWISSLSGQLTSKIVIDCNCKSKMVADFKSAVYKYEMPMQIITNITKRTSSIRVFGDYTKSILSLLEYHCCKNGDISFEDPALELDPNENISLPNQTIGGFGGVGFGQDFEETSICLGAEYLNNVTDLGNNPLFVGANVQLETSSFMDNTNTWVGVGPTAQLFTPLTPSHETHITNGLSANYIFGSNDNGVTKDNLSGFNIIFNTGVNMQLSDNLSLALILPVLTYTNLTFEAENGGATFEQSSTSLFLGKGSSTKIGLRFGF